MKMNSGDEEMGFLVLELHRDEDNTGMSTKSRERRSNGVGDGAAPRRRKRGDGEK